MAKTGFSETRFSAFENSVFRNGNRFVEFDAVVYDGAAARAGDL